MIIPTRQEVLAEVPKEPIFIDNGFSGPMPKFLVRWFYSKRLQETRRELALPHDCIYNPFRLPGSPFECFTRDDGKDIGDVQMAEGFDEAGYRKYAKIVYRGLKTHKSQRIWIRKYEVLEALYDDWDDFIKTKRLEFGLVT